MFPFTRGTHVGHLFLTHSGLRYVELAEKQLEEFLQERNASAEEARKTGFGREPAASLAEGDSSVRTQGTEGTEGARRST